MTGLDDFGDPDHLDGLRVLLSSYKEEAALTPAGSKQTRMLLRGALVSRLLSEAAWKQYPARAPIERPIFVTGLPRTGTTALHRLLAADPAHQGLELWLTEVPQPRPPRATWDAHPVYAMLRDAYREHSEFDGVHHLGPDQVEECWRLLCQSMRSVSFECTAYIPAYSAWLSEQDWTGAYRRHRRNLELIGLDDPGRRWVLKNPSHLFALDALLAVYPDAVVIQTHRDPRAVIGSVCSLNAVASEGWSTIFSGQTLGRAQLALWSGGLRRFGEARARHDPAHFIDVDYDDFVADPLGTIAGIYQRLGLPWSDGARAAMTAVHAESQRGTRKPAHAYSLETYGLTPEEVDRAFDVSGGADFDHYRGGVARRGRGA
ncbi:sulfotransferase [Actinoplanes sp. OR16]|uniref:sulfotransferase family protein n=1 Tax=Actinoplanes sp. OR16 TaxID=946334 RepID=UPI000FD6EF0A|nr:sulfotransferase [Actinoplanes sp. OR16]